MSLINRFQALAEAWCERKSVEEVLGFLTDDVVWHFAVAAAPPAVGIDAARTVLEGLSGQIERSHWRVFEYAERGNTLFVEGVDENVLPNGHRTVAPYMGILEFRGEQICAWRDYFDRGSVSAQLRDPEAPLKEHVSTLIARPAV